MDDIAQRVSDQAIVQRKTILRLADDLLDGAYEAIASAEWAGAALFAGLYATSPRVPYAGWLVALSLGLLLAGFFNRYQGPPLIRRWTSGSADYDYVVSMDYKTFDVLERKFDWGLSVGRLATIVADCVTLVGVIVAFQVTSNPTPFGVALVVVASYVRRSGRRQKVGSRTEWDIKLTIDLEEAACYAIASADWAGAALFAGLYATNPGQYSALLFWSAFLVFAGIFSRYVLPRRIKAARASSGEDPSSRPRLTRDAIEGELRVSVKAGLVATVLANIATIAGGITATAITSNPFALGVAVAVTAYLSLISVQWILKRRRAQGASVGG